MTHKMVRIFVSSTFYNFKEERDGLVLVFEELSEYCKSEGFSFQVLDLRWGISKEDGQNNRTLQICFDEIARCQMLSPKPNFLVLAGLYYGWIPLPFIINKYVWDKISDEIPSDSLLRNWYLQDENDVNLSYILRSRKEEKDKNKWGITESLLKEELFPLIRKHFPEESKWYEIYGLSATEQEIYKGLFTHPESKEHVFVLLRTKEPEYCIKEEADDIANQTVALQAHLKDYMGALTDSNMLFYQPGDDYIQKVKIFLRQVIQSRIAEVQRQEALLTPFQRELCMLDEAVRKAEENYIEVNDNLNNFLNCCKENYGKIILLTGTSGSGKSMLLSHCYAMEQQNFVLSCADLLPSCRRIAHALWFCLKQLQRRGILFDLETESDAEHCVTWFERQLAGFHSSIPITILLDSVEQIYDWNQIGGSLLACRLPRNLTFVISCISELSLNERDRIKNIFVYQILQLVKPDSICMLKQLLWKRERTLREKDELFLRQNLPKEVTPLYIQLLCRQFQKRHSFDCMPLILPIGTKESIFLQLKVPNSNYEKLYKHIIGYLALAVDGLSEQELLILLERDKQVLQEITQHTHWTIKQNCFTLSVFWARIHYFLKDYLSEVDSNGILLLHFHHDLVRQTVIDIVGKEELMQLSENISTYFKEEPIYLKYSKDNIVVNFRKLRELVPALRYQNDWVAVAEVLAMPQYVDGCLRCGWYREVMQQYMELGQHKHLYDIHQKILSLLQEKAMLFQLWGESFLPAAVESGIWSRMKKTDIVWQYMLLYNSKHKIGKNIQESKMLLPNASNVKIAVKNDGTLAILEGTVLKRYDLNLCSEIYSRTYIDLTNAFLYWKGNTLIVRDEYNRLSFCDTGSELVQIKREQCHSLVDLYSDDIHKIIRAGGFEERDYADFFRNTIFEYHFNGTLKGTELFYSEIEDIKCFCHSYLCAVLLNHQILQIIDLNQRLVLASYAVYNACFAYWNEQGTQVLIVFERDKVQFFSYNYKNPIPLANPQMSIKDHEKAYKKRIGRKKILEIFQFSCPVNKKDTPVYTNSVLGSRQPVFAAFTIKGNRLACYYYYLNQGSIRLFRLDNRELLAESTVDPIFWNDSVGRPIFFNEEGNEIIYISRGKKHIWKMDSLKWEHNVLEKTNSQSNFVTKLQERYFSCVESWLPSGSNRKFQDQKNIRKVLRKMLMLILSPLVCSAQIDRDNNMLLRQSMRQVSVVESGDFWWIVDCHHSMIHVCDNSGCWVCHEQLQIEILDFNVIDNTIYVLPQDLSAPIRLDIVSV